MCSSCWIWRCFLWCWINAIPSTPTNPGNTICHWCFCSAPVRVEVKHSHYSPTRTWGEKKTSSFDTLSYIIKKWNFLVKNIHRMFAFDANYIAHGRVRIVPDLKLAGAFSSRRISLCPGSAFLDGGKARKTIPWLTLVKANHMLCLASGSKYFQNLWFATCSHGAEFGSMV